MFTIIGSDAIEVTNAIFKRGKIRFTQPRTLNDPLEFYPTMLLKDLPANYQNYELDGLTFPSNELFYRVHLIESQINNYGLLSPTKIPD
jgi:hypothetical protein